MARYLGIDPDTKTPGFAIVAVSGKVVTVQHAGVLRGDGNRKALLLDVDKTFWELGVTQGVGIDAVVVEGQQIYMHGPHKTKDPKPIVTLAQAAGMLMAKALDQWPLADWDMPRPAEWKGQVKKVAHQAWVCEQVGWQYKRLKTGVRPAIPKVAHIWGDPENDEWSEVVDAVGLALWAATKKVWR